VRRRVPSGLAFGWALAGALLCTGVALAADQILGVVIPPAPSNKPVYSVTFGRGFTIRVEGAPQGQTWPCAVTAYLGNNWTSKSPKRTPFPVDFVFPGDFNATNQNLKLVVGTYNVTVLGQPEQGKNNACSGEKRIQIEVKPQTSNVYPPK
jgi:hypothetical protein